MSKPAIAEMKAQWERAQWGIKSLLVDNHPRWGSLGHIPFEALPGSIPEMVAFGYERGFEDGWKMTKTPRALVLEYLPNGSPMCRRRFSRTSNIHDRPWKCEVVGSFETVWNTWADKDIQDEADIYRRRGRDLEADLLEDLLRNPYETVSSGELQQARKEIAELKAMNEASTRDFRRIIGDLERQRDIARDERNRLRDDLSIAKDQVNSLLRAIEDVRNRTAGFARPVG